MGATVSEMTVIDLRIEVAQRVAKGEVLAELESDKSVFELEAPCDGKISHIFGGAGEILSVGSPFVRIETLDTSMLHLKALASESVTSSEEIVEESPLSLRPPASPVSKLTPKARKLAEVSGVSMEAIHEIEGTGPGGRVTGDDLALLLERTDAGQKVASREGNGALRRNSSALETETVCVSGIGYSVPQRILSNDEIRKNVRGENSEDPVRLTGIRQRYVIGAGESVTSLGLHASNKALAAASLRARDIDAIIVATVLADEPIPGAASDLANALGLGEALAFDLNAACSGWLYALEVGRSFILAGTARNVLVVTAEAPSRITNKEDPDTAFLFGDGAGAAVLTRDTGGHRLHRHQLSGDSRFAHAIRRQGGGALQPVPLSEENLDDFYMKMDGGLIFKKATIAFSNIIDETLERHGLTSGDVSWVVPHQANARILKAVSKRVGIAYDRFVVTVDRFGNTSAASVAMALAWAAEEGLFEKGDKIVLCSVGGGLTYAAGLMVW